MTGPQAVPDMLDIDAPHEIIAAAHSFADACADVTDHVGEVIRGLSPARKQVSTLDQAIVAESKHITDAIEDAARAVTTRAGRTCDRATDAARTLAAADAQAGRDVGGAVSI